MPTVLVLLAEGFEEIEVFTPVDLLRRAGADVTIASLADHRHVTGRNGITVHADAALSEIGEHLFDLLFLPGYSPNLNLIERLWKFIKKDCLNGRYYPTHQQFQAAILASLDGINTRHQETLKTTLTLNFQMFDKVQLLAA